MLIEKTKQISCGAVRKTNVTDIHFPEVAQGTLEFNENRSLLGDLKANSKPSGNKKMSVTIIGSTVLLGLSGFPEVQFTLYKEENLEHVVHSTLSMADAFTHYGIIFCHTYRMQPSCL